MLFPVFTCLCHTSERISHNQVSISVLKQLIWGCYIHESPSAVLHYRHFRTEVIESVAKKKSVKRLLEFCLRPFRLAWFLWLYSFWLTQIGCLWGWDSTDVCRDTSLRRCSGWSQLFFYQCSQRKHSATPLLHCLKQWLTVFVKSRAVLDEHFSYVLPGCQSLLCLLNKSECTDAVDINRIPLFIVLLLEWPK